MAEHDAIFLANRRTPKIVKRGERYTPKPSEGKIVKRRRLTADEEKIIARGDWLRVNQRGEKPGDSGYMKKRSKVRPQLGAGVLESLTAASQSWRWQLRDNKGRWIEMGAEVKWLVKGLMHMGRIVDSPAEGQVVVEERGGRRHTLAANAVEVTRTVKEIAQKVDRPAKAKIPAAVSTKEPHNPSISETTHEAFSEIAHSIEDLPKDAARGMREIADGISKIVSDPAERRQVVSGVAAAVAGRVAERLPNFDRSQFTDTDLFGKIAAGQDLMLELMVRNHDLVSTVAEKAVFWVDEYVAPSSPGTGGMLEVLGMINPYSDPIGFVQQVFDLIVSMLEQALALIASGALLASQSWRWQLRDRYGRWIEMGAEVKWLAKGRWMHGLVVDSPDESTATVEESSTKERMDIPTASLEVVEKMLNAVEGKSAKEAGLERGSAKDVKAVIDWNAKNLAPESPAAGKRRAKHSQQMGARVQKWLDADTAPWDDIEGMRAGKYDGIEVRPLAGAKGAQPTVGRYDDDTGNFVLTEAGLSGDPGWLKSLITHEAGHALQLAVFTDALPGGDLNSGSHERWAPLRRAEASTYVDQNGIKSKSALQSPFWGDGPGSHADEPKEIFADAISLILSGKTHQYRDNEQARYVLDWAAEEMGKAGWPIPELYKQDLPEWTEWRADTTFDGIKTWTQRPGGDEISIRKVKGGYSVIAVNHHADEPVVRQAIVSTLAKAKTTGADLLEAASVTAGAGGWCGTTLSGMRSKNLQRAILTALVAGGGDSWKWQLRDADGKWIEMGAIVSWFYKGAEVFGEIVGSPSDGVARVRRNDNGKEINLYTSSLRVDEKAAKAAKEAKHEEVDPFSFDSLFKGVIEEATNPSTKVADPSPPKATVAVPQPPGTSTTDEPEPPWDDEAWSAVLDSYDLSELRQKVAKINDRAVKKGLTGRIHVLARKVEGGKWEVQTQGRPKLDSKWELAAVIDGSKPETAIVNRNPNAPDEILNLTIDKSMAGHCDYCNTSRDRKTTYVLKGKTGETKYVGSSCLADFLGHSVALGKNPFDTGEEEIDGWLGEKAYLPSSEVLFQTIRVVDKFGFKKTSELVNTRDMVQLLLHDEYKFEQRYGTLPHLTDADKERIRAERDEVLEWARAGVSITNTDYRANLGAALSDMHMSPKNLGLVVSAITSYRREKQKLAEKKAKLSAIKQELVAPVGTKITKVPSRIVGISKIQTQFGISTKITFYDKEGHRIVWWASNPPANLNEGDEILLSGKVKKEDTYGGGFSTIITHGKIEPNPVVAASAFSPAWTGVFEGDAPMLDALLAASDSWRWQLRDRYGKWIEMGAEVKWLARGRWLQGTVVGSPNERTATVKESRTKQQMNLPTASLEVVDAKSAVKPGQSQPKASKATLKDMGPGGRPTIEQANELLDIIEGRRGTVPLGMWRELALPGGVALSYEDMDATLTRLRDGGDIPDPDLPDPALVIEPAPEVRTPDIPEADVPEVPEVADFDRGASEAAAAATALREGTPIHERLSTALVGDLSAVTPTEEEMAEFIRRGDEVLDEAGKLTSKLYAVESDASKFRKKAAYQRKILKKNKPNMTAAEVAASQKEINANQKQANELSNEAKALHVQKMKIIHEWRTSDLYKKCSEDLANAKKREAIRSEDAIKILDDVQRVGAMMMSTARDEIRKRTAAAGLDIDAVDSMSQDDLKRMRLIQVETVAELVSKIRGGRVGGSNQTFPDGKPKISGVTSRPVSKEERTVISDAMALYPTEWIEHFDAKYTDLTVSFGLRASFSQGAKDAHLMISDQLFQGTERTGHTFGAALHELGHGMEHSVPGLLDLEKVFWATRVYGRDPVNEPVNLNDYGTLYQSDGASFPQKPVSDVNNNYSLKVYRVGSKIDALEVFTTGIEDILGHSEGRYVGGDDDFKTFVLGALAVLGGSGPVDAAAPVSASATLQRSIIALLAASDSWRWQLRDRYGKWIEMGAEVKWLARGRWLQGLVTGSPRPGVATVEERHSRKEMDLPTSSLEIIKNPDGSKVPQRSSEVLDALKSPDQPQSKASKAVLKDMGPGGRPTIEQANELLDIIEGRRGTVPLGMWRELALPGGVALSYEDMDATLTRLRGGESLPNPDTDVVPEPTLPVPSPEEVFSQRLTELAAAATAVREPSSGQSIGDRLQKAVNQSLRVKEAGTLPPELTQYEKGQMAILKVKFDKAKAEAEARLSKASQMAWGTKEHTALMAEYKDFVAANLDPVRAEYIALRDRDLAHKNGIPVKGSWQPVGNPNPMSAESKAVLADIRGVGEQMVQVARAEMVRRREAEGFDGTNPPEAYDPKGNPRLLSDLWAAELDAAIADGAKPKGRWLPNIPKNAGDPDAKGIPALKKLVQPGDIVRVTLPAVKTTENPNPAPVVKTIRVTGKSGSGFGIRVKDETGRETYLSDYGESWAPIDLVVYRGKDIPRNPDLDPNKEIRDRHYRWKAIQHEVMAEVIAGVRGLAETTEQTFEFKKKSSTDKALTPEMTEMVKDALLKVYPKAWVERMDRKTKNKRVTFSMAKRGSFDNTMHMRLSDYSGEKEARGGQSHGTAVHEWMHAMEGSISGLVEVQEIYWFERMFGPDKMDVAPIPKGAEEDGGWFPTGSKMASKFRNRYTSKKYTFGSVSRVGWGYEIMTTGVQDIFGEVSGAYVGGDDDLKAFVLGTLATLG